jgi:hypothetical protein
VASALSAFGVEPRELPLTSQRIWEMVEAGRRLLTKASANPSN